jgi:hypothetical protein
LYDDLCTPHADDTQEIMGIFAWRSSDKRKLAKHVVVGLISKLRGSYTQAHGLAGRHNSVSAAQVEIGATTTNQNISE